MTLFLELIDPCNQDFECNRLDNNTQLAIAIIYLQSLAELPTSRLISTYMADWRT